MSLELGTEIPPTNTWVKKSSNFFGQRDSILKHIDGWLAAFNISDPRSVEETLALSELFFSLDYWLKESQRNPKKINGKKDVVMELYKLTVTKLCRNTSVPINALPRWLDETFGKGMTTHGFKKDYQQRSANYFTPDKVARYRLEFKDGLAYQQSWWLNSTSLVKVDTFVLNANKDAAGKTMFPNEEYHQGYVLSLSRDFYMMQHFTPGATAIEEGRFHSSYFAGETVLCAGTLKFVKGQVKTVTTASGHYAPGITHLYNAVSTLAMLGVNLDEVIAWVYGKPAGEKATDVLASHMMTADNATERFRTERTVGSDFIQAAQIAAGTRALAGIEQKKKDDAERISIIEHFKLPGHKTFDCKVCKALRNNGTYAQFAAAQR